MQNGFSLELNSTFLLFFFQLSQSFSFFRPLIFHSVTFFYFSFSLQPLLLHFPLRLSFIFIRSLSFIFHYSLSRFIFICLFHSFSFNLFFSHSLSIKSPSLIFILFHQISFIIGSLSSSPSLSFTFTRFLASVIFIQAIPHSSCYLSFIFTASSILTHSPASSPPSLSLFPSHSHSPQFTFTQYLNSS